MTEFTRAYLSPFPWAKAAYDYSLGLSTNDLVSVGELGKISSIAESLPWKQVDFNQEEEVALWNKATRGNSSALSAMYRTLDQLEAYVQNLYTKLNARLVESEDRIQQNEQDLKALRSTLGLSSTTSITVKGGDLTSIDLDGKWYKDSGALKADFGEGVFRLADTGYFSSLRSLGGYAGTIKVERQLGHMVEVGGLESLVDGGRTTFWMGTHYSPAPLRADTNDIPWLPEAYKHGFACMLTYYLDRPTLASEIFLDPVSSEPFYLISVGYTPWGIANALSLPTFEASGSWTYSSNTQRLTGIGVDNTFGVLVTPSTGNVSQTFSLVANLNRTVSGQVVPATSGDALDARVEVVYSMRGKGDCRAGLRLVWLDNSGNVISYKMRQDFPTGFYRNLRLVDYAPALAVSGRVELGIFTPTLNGSAYFDNAVVHVGEQRKYYNQLIDRPTTVQIRNKSGAVLTQRFSFVLAQTNPRRETLSKESAAHPLQTFSGLRDVDPVAQHSTELLNQEFQNKGPGEQVFAYRLGLKELDVRNREFVPRGTLVTYPLKSRREIRRMWITSELSKAENEGVAFYIYPFSSDQNTRVGIEPYLLGDLDETQYSTGIGQVLYIFTQEEVASGWATNVGETTLLVDPKPHRQQFDGTDRLGKARLTEAPHLRRPEMQSLSDWLDMLSAKPGVLDPNAETVFGIVDDTVRNAIRSGAVSGLTMPASAITSRSGYVPIKVVVRTDKWTAHQDTFGRPDAALLQYVESEELESTDVFDTISTVQDDVLTFEAWLNVATPNKYPTLKWVANLNNQLDPQIATFRQYLDTFTPNFYYQNTSNVRQAMKQLYDQLKAQGQLDKNTSEVHSQTATLGRAGVYKTKHKNLVVSPGGTHIQLFWYNSTTGTYLSIPRNAFKVRGNVGLIELLKDAPNTGYDKIFANYWYLPDNSAEDYSSQSLSYLTEGASSMQIAHSHAGMRARTYPVCRNMTDYQTGRIPELRAPDFDPLSRTWYPVIEYYVTADNELQFARDFFRHGDMPAQIEVEYLTLGLNPRAAAEVERSGSPSASSSIASFSLFVKEGAASPLRKVE